MSQNKLVILKGRFFCNECTGLVSVMENEIYCIPQDGTVICKDCYESLKNREDVLLIGD